MHFVQEQSGTFTDFFLTGRIFTCQTKLVNFIKIVRHFSTDFPVVHFTMGKCATLFEKETYKFSFKAFDGVSNFCCETMLQQNQSFATESHFSQTTTSQNGAFSSKRFMIRFQICITTCIKKRRHAYVKFNFTLFISIYLHQHSTFHMSRKS